MNVPWFREKGRGKREEGKGETNMIFPFAKFYYPHNLYGNIVGEGLAPPEQTNCFIIVYGYHCRAGVYSRRLALIKLFGNPCRARRPRRAEQTYGLYNT